MLTEPTARSYLIRAVYDWCVDSGLTPYILVAVDDRVEVPKAFVKDSQIVLNIGPTSTKDLRIDRDMIAFGARFSGQPHQIFVPPSRVLAIYARENTMGLAFPLITEDSDGSGSGDETTVSKQKKPEGTLTRPQLHRVK
jgi:stringent starvation protein B